MRAEPNTALAHPSTPSPPTPQRDGTVYSAVTLASLAQPELLYRKLGAKLVVGMPFKDIATSGGWLFDVCWGCGLAGEWSRVVACSSGSPAPTPRHPSTPPPLNPPPLNPTPTPPDAIFMRDLPAASDKDGRRALRRLQEVGVHVIAPAAALAAAPLAGAVALVPLRDALKGAKLPEVRGGVSACAMGVEGDA
jgi:(E)-4-hydroxy-3-methylbut-2-enyl-diphosphate synthase